VLRFARIAPKCGIPETAALELIERMLASPPALTGAQRKALHFYASKILDRLRRYDEAFEQARLGHAADPVRFDPHAFRAQMNRQAAWFTPERLAALPKATHGWTQPVFIVGMPRSGSTLVEQILDGHGDVFGAGELLDLTQIVNRIATVSRGDIPGFLSSATPSQLDGLAGLYLSRVVTMAPPAARYITDKLPFNWMHLGVVSRLFPEARVIHVVRDPLDTCLSCYMTYFFDAVLYAADLRHLGMQYVDHVRLMDHWRTVLELPILEVSYEALIDQPEAQVRRMLEFLDLPWDERCVRFHENRRVADTASIDQVRQPLYRSSIGRWKHYESHLAPLIETLKELD
jgi:hypothetical protein